MKLLKEFMIEGGSHYTDTEMDMEMDILCSRGKTFLIKMYDVTPQKKELTAEDIKKAWYETCRSSQRPAGGIDDLIKTLGFDTSEES